jgi:hypothetical protein
MLIYIALLGAGLAAYAAVALIWIHIRAEGGGRMHRRRMRHPRRH